MSSHPSKQSVKKNDQNDSLPFSVHVRTFKRRAMIIGVSVLGVIALLIVVFSYVSRDRITDEALTDSVKKAFVEDMQNLPESQRILTNDTKQSFISEMPSIQNGAQ